MKKIFSVLCAGTLVMLATACGGNKAENHDSDSVLTDTIVVAEEDTMSIEAADSVLNATEEAVEEEVADAKQTAKKATNTVKNKVNNAKEDVKQAAETAKDNASSAADRVIERTKAAAEKGVNDAAEKAKAWKDKKKKNNE